MACTDVADLRNSIRDLSFDCALDRLDYHRRFMRSHTPAASYWHAQLCVIVALYRAELFRRTGFRHF
jgi:hypothetical protein